MEKINRSNEYFESKILQLYEGINGFLTWISTGKTPVERINIVKRAVVWDFICVINCKISLHKTKSTIVEDVKKAIEVVGESWDGFWKADYKGEKLNQYILSAYDEMLWMLSLGYLLNVSEDDFKKLVEVIDRDGVKDYLFEFIIAAKLKDRQPITEESYRELFGVPRTFEKLREAIIGVDKTITERLVKEFVTKEWYKNHREAGWYDSHKSKHDTYYGYWSFETAAVVKIMGLDDSSFIDCQYYPKDLVHQ